MNTKNFEEREGWNNRWITPLPTEAAPIIILTRFDEEEYLVEWTPYDPTNYSYSNQPADGYLGTASVLTGRFAGIGFHAWEQNDSEFVYWQHV